jgi:hypothetical protein
MLLVASLLCCGFFPQFFVRMVAPTFRTSLSENTSHFANMQRYRHGAVSANGAEFIASLGQDRIPGALPQAHMTKAPLALDNQGAVRRPGAAAVAEGNGPQPRRHNDLASK